MRAICLTILWLITNWDRSSFRRLQTPINVFDFRIWQLISSLHRSTSIRNDANSWQCYMCIVLVERNCGLYTRNYTNRSLWVGTVTVYWTFRPYLLNTTLLFQSFHWNCTSARVTYWNKQIRWVIFHLKHIQSTNWKVEFSTTRFNFLSVTT